MDNIFEHYKKPLFNNKNQLLESYANLIVNYENSKQCYEKIIKEFEANSIQPEIICDKLVCYNSGSTPTVWTITLSSGRVIYQSNTCYKDDTFTMELKTILIPKTIFTIISSASQTKFTATYLLYCHSIAYFGEDSIFRYYGTIPVLYVPNGNASLKCAEIQVYNNSEDAMKCTLTSLDGTILYESGYIYQYKHLTIELINTDLIPYTKFNVNAVFKDNSITTADASFEYVLDADLTGNLTLSGTLSKNILMYVGATAYTPSDATVIKCSNIVAYSLAPDITRWQVTLIDGTILYVSGNYLQYQTFTFNLSILSLLPGTKLKFMSVNASGSESISDLIFEYDSTKATLYFSVDNYNASSHISYNGLAPTPYKPPVIKCSSINAEHTEFVIIMRWQLLKEDGYPVYEGDMCSKGSDDYIDLASLNIVPGTRLKLKASVTAADDSTAYILLEYSPDTYKTAKFGFYGNSFRTIVSYKGY